MARLTFRHLEMRDLGMSLIQGKDGIVYEERLKDKTFGLHFFTTLLNDNRTSDFAQKQIRTRYNSPLRIGMSNNSPVHRGKHATFAEKMLKDDMMVAGDADWANFCIQLLCEVKDPGRIFSSAWNRLNQVDNDGNKLIKDRSRISIEFLRFLFVHPSSKVRGYARSLIDEKVCTPADLGASFLKTIATKRE